MYRAIVSQMKRLWFRAKRYGWGWYPVSLEGWFITLLFMAAIAASAAAFNVYIRSIADNPHWLGFVAILGFMLWFVLLVKGMLIICAKTGERQPSAWARKKEKRRKRRRR